MNQNNSFPASQLLSKSSGQINTSEIRKVFELAKSIQNPLNLSIGQPDFQVPEPVKQAFIKATQDNLTAYTLTKGIVPLREKLAEKYNEEIGNFYNPENIVISGGTAAILKLLFETMFDPGDEILLIDPYFLIYEALVGYHQLKAYYVNENFSAEELAEATKDSKRIKMIIFSSPSNPTGKIFSKQQLQSLTNLARQHQSVIVSDEIYCAYDYDGKFTSCAQLYPEGTLILNGFSKSHSMTGLRIGYILAPEPLTMIIDKIATLQQYSVVCASQPAQWAAITALDTNIDDLVAKMKNRRSLVLKALTDVVSFTYPDGAFYLFPEVPVDSQVFAEEAIKHRLLLVPGFIFSKNRKLIRISYAQDETILEEALSVFVKLVNQFK